MIRACILLALATCAFGVYSGYPYGYSGAAPAAYGSYHAPSGSLSSYGYGLGQGVPSYGYGLGSYGLSYGQGLGGLGYSSVLHKK
ncbi:shematrin-like protein 1 [Dermacentor silvarum]|uniref:shematrin-like protein 1 n=1 Tax=Dermacentor silvarum TaxID=543639 RepID=UPI002100DDB0|nr:shematrin-like protein 1 [Dermacentor silvarum]